jgi:hypothetical protein
MWRPKCGVLRRVFPNEPTGRFPCEVQFGGDGPGIGRLRVRPFGESKGMLLQLSAALRSVFNAISYMVASDHNGAGDLQVEKMMTNPNSPTTILTFLFRLAMSMAIT